MFKSGFNKIAAMVSPIVPKSLGSMTGKPAQNIFGRPIRQFGKMTKTRPLVPLSSLKDGMR